MLVLPIDEFLPGIVNRLKNENRLVVTAAPGAGKTTRLPPAFVSTIDKKIIVLEPRRMAAVAAASRIAAECGWTLGREVGYVVRFDSKVTPDTKLIFMTEALLQRKILADPELSDVGLIILDEFHERSLNVDLAIGAIKELQELSRPDLKLIVMSATLQSTALAQYLGTMDFVDVPGKLYELTIQNQKDSSILQTNGDWVKSVTSAIKSAIETSTTKKNTLVFVPGVGEIERVTREITDWAQGKNIEVLPLHGSLGLEQQMKVLNPSPSQKIIVATNIAESSVTVDGVDTVIDSGLARIMKLNTKTGFSQLTLSRISKASATQRAGRAARQSPGRCIRLWSPHDEKSMNDFEIPEILRTELSEALLFLASLGISDFSKFSWFEGPTGYQLQKATDELKHLGALSPDRKLTELGKKLATKALPPRLALLMLKAEEKNQISLGADLCTILQEKDFVLGGSESYLEECDICFRYDLLFDYRNNGHPKQVSMSTLKRVDQASKSLRGNSGGKQFTHRDLKNLLLEVFKDRLGKRRRSGDITGVLSSGRGVKISDKSTVRNSEFFLALQLTDLGNVNQSSDTLVSLASGIDSDMIKTFLSAETTLEKEISLDPETFRMVTTEFKAWRKLPLGEPRRRSSTIEEVAESLPTIAFENFNLILQKNEPLGKWWQRFNYFFSRGPEFQIEVAPLNQEIITNALAQSCYGENSLQTLFTKDLIYYFESMIDADTVRKFNHHCPSTLELPSGKKVEISYPKDQSPSFEVRLQELFGTKENPTVFDGKIPITIILLAPNFRPVQTTQDLKSFWNKTYFEVKKELKARYPKHYWPEDPLVAEPRQYNKKR